MEEATLFRDRVRERDLDNFLVEELSASLAFRKWMLSRVSGVFEPPDVSDVRIQKSPPRAQDSRQTDVRIGWFEQGILSACILIESKVTADFQPGQAAAYADEVRHYQNVLGSQRAVAILIAPAARLASLEHFGAFTVDIAVENIFEFLGSRLADHSLDQELAARLKVRIELLQALCGKRSGTGWAPATIQAKRDFAEAYTELAAQIVPEVSVRPSTDGPGATTRIFEGLALPHDLPRATLRHEFGKREAWKYANLQFPGLAHRYEAVRTSDLTEGTPYIWELAGKSLALRVRTEGIDPTRPFEEEERKVRASLLAIKQLLHWTRLHASDLCQLLRAS